MNDLREKIAKILERHDFAGDDWWDNVGDLFFLFTEELEKKREKGYEEGSAQNMSSDAAWSVGQQAYREGIRDGKNR